ncbi:uncharacterized protein LOC127565772 [Drosophila albomicans]|uniref:Uncharacterized protein LOC127565772 n=1 Tax=Drosophila albomicans TaxID=7291 RepID=A0A9C6SYQ4_DROAB|nr:uncharacterized protein LOC127565772 [Drosophila albomicans]
MLPLNKATDMAKITPQRQQQQQQQQQKQHEQQQQALHFIDFIDNPTKRKKHPNNINIYPSIYIFVCTRNYLPKYPTSTTTTISSI